MRPVARTLAALFALTTAFAAAAGAQALIGPLSSAIPIGAQNDTIVVPLVVDLSGAGGASLGSVTARLRWRASVLRFVGVSAGTFGAPAVNPDSANGVLRIAAASATGATGTPTIVNARFQAIGPLGDTTLLSVVVDEMTAAGTLAAISNVPTSALVCVGSVAGRWGDATGDDQVMSNDALAIVTHAVGLAAPPLTTINGDVDSSGTVTTRDALIVLSFAVGLNTSAFRVNVLRPSLCGAGSPIASVTLTPGTALLLPGDRLPLTVVARDATSAPMHTPRVTYVSTNLSVATVDGSGQVTGVAPGSADVIAILSPLLADTATITVGGSRNVWYVNAAAGNAVEHGSAAYPFATVAQALASATDDDTIMIATGDYGEALVIDRPLTVIGDSTAQGFPRLRPTAGPAIIVNSANVTVVVRRLELPNTDGGVRAHGNGLGLLELDRVRVTGSRSAGITATGFGTVLITEGGIFGATDTGIDVDSTVDVQILRVTVDQVAGRSTASPAGFTLRVRDAGNLTLDSVQLLGGRAVVTAVSTVSVNRSRIGENTGRGLLITAADSVGMFATRFTGMRDDPSDSAGLKLALLAGGRVSLDSVAITTSDGGLEIIGGRSARLRRVVVQLAGGGARALAVVGPDTVEMDRTSVTGGDVHLSAIAAAGALARVDTLSLQGGRIDVRSYNNVILRDLVVAGGLDELVKVDVAINVVMERIEARGARFTPGAYSFGPFAVQVRDAATVTLDSLWIHDNAAGALSVFNADTVGVLRSRFVASYLSSGTGQAATAMFQLVRRLRVARTLLDERGGASVYSMYLLPSATAGTHAIDSTTFIGSGYAVTAAGSSFDTLRIERSQFTPAGPQDRIQYATYVSGMGHFVVDGNSVDSTDQIGFYAQGIYSGIVTNNTIRYGRSYGVYLYGNGSGLPLVTTDNLIDCDTTSNAPGIFMGQGPATATGNTVRDCPVGIQIGTFSGPYAAVVRNNTVDIDSIDGNAGIYISGSLSRPVVSQNILTGGRWELGAIYASGGSFDSLRVDSNVIRRGRGTGIRIDGNIQHPQIRGNRIDSLRILDTFDVAEAAIRLAYVGGVGRIAHDTIRGREVSGIYQEYWNGDTLRIDSTVIVDHPWFGIKLYDGGTMIAGFRNYVARNGRGMSGTGGIVAMSQSTFENNDTVGVSANGGAWSMANNYWGHSSGPRCGASCPGALGDSVDQMTGFLPFLAAPDPGTPMGIRMSLMASTMSVDGSVSRRPAPGAVGLVVPRARGRSAVISEQRRRVLAELQPDIPAPARPRVAVRR